MKGTILFFLFAFATPVMAQQQQYFVWDGNTLQPLYNTQGVTCDHWAIWVYTDSTTNPQPAKGWGEIDGASAGEVQGKYEKVRDMMERILSSHSTGYEVHVGPVAIVKPAPRVDDPAFKPTSGEADDLYDRILKDLGLGLQLVDAYDKYVKEPGYHGLYTDPKSDLQNYLKDLHDQLERVNKLRHELNTTNDAALADVQQQLHAMTESLKMTENQGQSLANTLHVQAGSSSSTDWLNQDGAEKSGSGVHTKVTAFDGLQTGFTVTVTYGGANSTAPIHYKVPYKNISSAQMASQDNQVMLGLTADPFAIYVSFPNADDAQQFLEYVKRRIGDRQ